MRFPDHIGSVEKLFVFADEVPQVAEGVDAAVRGAEDPAFGGHMKVRGLKFGVLDEGGQPAALGEAGVVPLEHLADFGGAADAGHAELVVEFGVVLTPFEQAGHAGFGDGGGGGFGRRSKVELHVCEYGYY